MATSLGCILALHCNDVAIDSDKTVVLFWGVKDVVTAIRSILESRFCKLSFALVAGGGNISCISW